MARSPLPPELPTEGRTGVEGLKQSEVLLNNVILRHKAKAKTEPAKGKEGPEPAHERTIAYDWVWVHRVIVIVLKADPSKEEWNAYCAFVAKHGKGLQGIAVYDFGGQPTASQRAQVKQTLAYTPRLAIFTTSALMRGAVTAFCWEKAGNDKLIRAFPHEEETQALETHLGIGEPGFVLDAKTRLRAALGLK